MSLKMKTFYIVSSLSKEHYYTDAVNQTRFSTLAEALADAKKSCEFRASHNLPALTYYVLEAISAVGTHLVAPLEAP